MSLVERLGLEGPHDRRLAWGVVALLLSVYTIAFALFPPDIAINDDEAMYLRQAELMLRGTAVIQQEHPLTGAVSDHYPSTYAPGTALLMAPFVGLFGPWGAFLLPLLSLLAAVLLTARWLEDEGRSPVFALLLLGFVPALVMGRVAMSDVPSAAWVMLGLWLFWRGQDRGAGWWLASGLVAGSSLVFRVSNPLVFIPLYAGTVLRRERNMWALVVGGLCGLGLRVVAMDFYFGTALFERTKYHLSVGTLDERLPLYALALLVFVPLGLVLSLAYRGRRRPEIVATILLFVAFYLLQRYSTATTGFAKRIILALRYLIPVVPVMAFAMAESVPRLWQGLVDRLGETARTRARLAFGAALAVWLVGVGVAAAAVHPFMAGWSGGQAIVRDAIATAVPQKDPFVTNWMATRKFFDVLDRPFGALEREEIDPAEIETLVERHGAVTIVFFDRHDSGWWRKNAAANAAFIAALPREPQLVLDREIPPNDRLRVWRLEKATR